MEVTKVEADAFENQLRGELTGVVDPTIQGAVDRTISSRSQASATMRLQYWRKLTRNVGF